MAAHLTEDVWRLIVEKCEAEVDTLQASKDLGIDHRTVKAYYEKARKNNLPTGGDTEFRRMFLEASRLLAWPTPKLYGVLERYEALLHGTVKRSSLLRASSEIRKQRERDNAAKIKGLSRYLERNILPDLDDPAPFQKTSRWEVGTAAVHAVPLEWQQHNPEKRRILVEGTGEPTAGWLLLLANRHCGNMRKRMKWKLKINLAVLLPGKELDKGVASRIVVERLQMSRTGILRLHLVCGEEGMPTATVSAEELRAMLPSDIEVMADLPTRGVKKPFRRQWSFPTTKSVANCLDVMVKFRGWFPADDDDFWLNLRREAAQENFSVQEFLARNG